MIHANNIKYLVSLLLFTGDELVERPLESLPECGIVDGGQLVLLSLSHGLDLSDFRPQFVRQLSQLLCF